MLMTQFSYSVTAQPKGVDVVLSRNSDGRQKVFFSAGDASALGVARLSGHMATLTDLQCESFFPVDRPAKAQKSSRASNGPAEA